MTRLHRSALALLWLCAAALPAFAAPVPPRADAVAAVAADPAAQAGAAQFQQYADNPLFILTHPL